MTLGMDLKVTYPQALTGGGGSSIFRKLQLGINDLSKNTPPLLLTTQMCCIF